MYQFTENLNLNQFFRFSKKWVLNMNWSMLPLRAKAVLPVVYAHDNGKGQSWPSEETISALSRLSPKTVRKGINELLSLPGFSFKWQMTATGRKSKKFKFPLPGNSEKVFFFHKVILTGGNWRLLKPIGKAIYPVLRTFSQWDRNEAYESEEIKNTDEDFKESFADREWEYSEAEPGILARYAGITRARVYDALRDLQECALIERSDGRWKVYLIPQEHYTRDFLNGQLIKSFRHKLRK